MARLFPVAPSPLTPHGRGQTPRDTRESAQEEIRVISRRNTTSRIGAERNEIGAEYYD